MVPPVLRASPWILIALGLSFRLWATEHARFTGDESDYWARSRQLVEGTHIPAYGPPITGSEAHLPGPAYYFLMAIPQSLGASPRFGSAFVALLHAWAAWLLYRLARRAGGQRAGIVALIWVAFAPWDVLYADRIWGSCIVPVWGTLALYATYRSSEEGWWQGGLLFLCLVLPQLHLSFPVLWAACGVLWVLRPPKQLHLLSLGIGLALSVAAYGAPLAAELHQGFSNMQKIFQQGTGGASWEEAIGAPVKVAAYAVLYASSEIGYHFARGYWGGGFSEVSAYLTGPGLSEHFARLGVVLGSGVFLSVGLAVAAWGAALVDLVPRLRRADADPRNNSEARAWTWALLAGLAAGGLLMFLARKTFFPHYANVLMPVLLLPPTFVVSHALGSRWRWPAALALGASVVTMAWTTVRYYREVDALNGLGPTLAMVRTVLAEGTPAEIRFTHFNNRYAWTMVARHLHGRSHVHQPGAPDRWIVHNHQPFRGPLSDQDQRFGPILLEHRPRASERPEASSDARRHWSRFTVEVEAPDGTVRPCVKSTGEHLCRYGDQPWQRFGPDVLNMGGRPRTILFLHPVQGHIVRARYPLAPGIRKIQLRYGLSDEAVRSPNPVPVHIRLSDDGQPLGEARATNHPGFFAQTFTRTSTGASTLSLELQTENEGARIFGFDLEWVDPRDS